MINFSRIPVIYKLLASVVFSLITLLVLLPYTIETLTRIMICWNAFALCYIIISFITFATTGTISIRHVARNQDTSNSVSFIILVLASISSIVAILLLIRNKEHWLLNKGLVTFIYLAGVVNSWILQHTIFSFHYAHMYYGDNKKSKPGGLVFPESEEPDYLDFAYFSFVIGMTFQVSDVTINSKRIRHFVLFHSLLSFGFNTVIVALSVNALVNG